MFSQVNILSFTFHYSIKDRGGGMPRALLDKIFDYHFSSNNLANEPSLLSYTDFENHFHDQLVTHDSTNRMSGYEDNSE